MPWSVEDRSVAPASSLPDDVFSQLNGGNLKVVQSLDVNPETLAKFALECLWAVVDGKLHANQLPLAIEATSVKHEVASAILAHVFWLVWSDIEGSKADSFCEEINAEEKPLDSEAASRVIEALAECRRNGILKEQDSLEVLELNLLVQSGQTAPQTNRNSFGRKIGIARNSKFLKIPTFTIFREELEGYAKLITLLNNPAIAQVNDAKRICTEVDQLAGYYQLNPSKVASCILVAMEQDLSSAQVLLQLPYLVPRWCMDHIKCTLQGQRAMSNPSPLSQAFFDIIALLLKEQKLVLEDVCKELAAEFDRLPDPKSMIQMVQTAVSETTPNGGHVLMAAALHLDLSATDYKVTELMDLPSSPAMQFMFAMVASGTWLHTRILLKQSRFRFLLHRDICKALTHRLENSLRQHSSVLFPLGTMGGCILPVPHGPPQDDLVAAAPLTPDILQMLEALGPLLFRRPDLLVLLWRIILHILLTHKPGDNAQNDAVLAIRNSALPASCFLASNTQVWLLVQRTLFELPQLLRCQLYHHTSNWLHIDPQHSSEKMHAMLQGPDLALLKAHASRIDSHLGTLCKKLTVPRTQEDVQRELRASCLHVGKVVTAHPVLAASRIVGLCSMYDTNTELFVSFSATMLPVEREIILYEAVRHFLIVPKARAGPQQIGPSDWLSNMGTFIGKFVTQHPDLDLYVMFAYLSQNIRRAKYPLEVLIASSIFDNSFGSLPEQVSSEQRRSLFYGPIMRSLKLKNDFFSPQTLAVQCDRLLRSLHGYSAKAPSLIAPLYVLLCQQRSNACSSADTTNFMGSFEATQRTHQVVLQYIELMKRLPLRELAKILPKLSILIQQCQIGAECAMAVYRPLLRLLCGLNVDGTPTNIKLGDDHTKDTAVIPLPNAGKHVLDNLVSSASDDCEWASGVIKAPAQIEEGATEFPDETHNQGMGVSVRLFFRDLCSCIPMLASQIEDQAQEAASSGKQPLAHGAKGVIGPQFYVMFWALELPDLAEQVEETYIDFEAMLKAEVEEKGKTLHAMENSESRGRTRTHHGRGGGQDEPMVTKADVAKAKEELTGLQEKLRKLPQERESQMNRAEEARKAFERYAIHFSPTGSGQKNICNAFMQECIVPRCIFSVEDALFCAQLLYRMAIIRPRHFQFPHALQAVFNEVSVLMRSCTQQETTNLAFFFKQMFLLVERLTKEKLLTTTDPNLDDSKWTILNKKHQKQMCTVLTTVLNAPDSGELIQKNALNMITELLVHIVVDQDIHTMLSASLRSLEKKEVAKKSGDVSSVQLLLNAALRQLENINPGKGQDPNRENKNDAEDGELEDGETPNEIKNDVDDGFIEKRPRDNGGDEGRHIRQRTAHMTSGGRQYVIVSSMKCNPWT